MGNLVLVTNDIEKSQTAFESLAKELASLFEGFSFDLQHIGSTAIPNALTKPVLDVLLITDTSESQHKLAELLTQHGFVQGELAKKQTKLFFYKHLDLENSFVEAIHLHLAYKNTPDKDDLISIKVRDYLLDHPREVELYNQEKQRLALLGNNDRSFYVSHKEPYIKKLTAKLAH